MIFSFIKKYYGDFNDQELRKYALLGVIYGIIVGIMWALMPVRDTLFCERIIGFSTCVDRQARENYFIWARVIALLVLIPGTMVYGRVVNRYHKETAFYIITALYVTFFLFFFLFFSLNHFEATPSPYYWSGWLWFMCVESFNTLFVSCFWAFVIDTSRQSQAQQGFGFIIMLGQLGGVIVPQILSSIQALFHTNQTLHIAGSSLLLLVAAGIMRIVVGTTPEKYMRGYDGVMKTEIAQRKELGLFEGLKLIKMYPYLIGITVLVFLFEYVIAMLDLNFKTAVLGSFSNAQSAAFVLSRYASYINMVTFILLIFGINNIQKIYGIRSAFMVTFVCMSGAVLLFFFAPNITMIMSTLIIAKSVNYALNSPSMKRLYIPTTTDVKYQSRAWTETFGISGAKAFGSLTGLGKTMLGAAPFLQASSFGCFVILCIWLAIAMKVSHRCDKAIKNNEIVC